MPDNERVLRSRVLAARADIVSHFGWDALAASAAINSPGLQNFEKWGDWNNSWKNWGDWKDWEKWGNWEMDGSGY